MTMTMTMAMVVERCGEPSVMHWREWPLTGPGPGQVQIRHTAVGFNMIDSYMRRGLYPIALPAVLGVEAAGVVSAVGEGVSSVAVGDRVAYLTREPGAYAEARNVAADRLLLLPSAISDEIAACSLLKGLTCWALLTRCYVVAPGDVVLIYAAAGGLGSLLCQWAKGLGAKVIGVVGGAAKVAAATACGCDLVIDRSTTAIVDAVRDYTDGCGVQVVYDSLGAASFEQSLDCLAPMGTMVSFGNATGPVPPIDILMLSRKGSLTLVRPTVFTYVERRADLERGAALWFEQLLQGSIGAVVGQRFALSDAASAHRAVESGATTGLTVLSV